MKARRASCGMRCGTLTFMGFSFGIKVIGMMTLSSSSPSSIVLAMGGSLIIWENPVGVQNCVDGDLEGAPGSVAGGVGVGCCNG